MQLVFFNYQQLQHCFRKPQNFRTQCKFQECGVWIWGTEVDVDARGAGRAQPELFCPTWVTNFTGLHGPQFCLRTLKFKLGKERESGRSRPWGLAVAIKTRHQPRTAPFGESLNDCLPISWCLGRHMVSVKLQSDICISFLMGNLFFSLILKNVQSVPAYFQNSSNRTSHRDLGQSKERKGRNEHNHQPPKTRFPCS